MQTLQEERAILVGLVKRNQSRWQVNDFLDELELLAETAGAEVMERMVQERNTIDPAFMIGRGKVQELAQTAKYLDADLVIFDDDLTPAQVKNIESICKVKILDRSGLILDIFAKHARTREARTQVELAQLNYLLPRLTRHWTHLSRQVGGIGVRGPGETQLEIDRRLIRKRIATLEKELHKIAGQRETRQKRRQDVFKVALVGYTNVGKSTLINALTDADILVQNQLFATLDSTFRAMVLDSGEKVLLIDTVGFIRKLPHHLVASFKSTLEAASEADLLLHVIDVTHPQYEEQMQTVHSVLSDLKLDKKPILNVFNKIDALKDPSLLSALEKTEQPCVFISAQRGIFLSTLKDQIKVYLDRMSLHMDLTLPIDRADLISRLHDMADVVSIDYDHDTASIRLKASPANAERIRRLTDQAK
jgi:GTP-binding protein HflX